MAVNRDDEIEQRVALLRRFRELLVEQRGKFERYLKVLDHEKADIESGDVDRLVAHVELEEQVVSEIYTFQKVIDPLDELYRSAFAASTGTIQGDRADVPALKEALGELRNEVIRRNAENRVLLKTRMELLRGEIAVFKTPLSSRKSVYASAGEGGIVDING